MPPQVKQAATLLATALVAAAPADPPPRIIAALRRADIIPRDPRLVTVRQLCRLRVDDRTLTALDIVVRIELAQEDRLDRRVVILDAALHRTVELRYFPPARALPCAGDHLRFSAPVTVDNTLPAGRRVRVLDTGHGLTVEPG